MTNNTQFKTLVNTWLNQKQPMITPSTHASFTLIAENHLIPYFGKRKIGSITETDIQSYISYLHDAGRLDKTGGLTVKTIRDVILVFRLSMEFAYKERAIPIILIFCFRMGDFTEIYSKHIRPYDTYTKTSFAVGSLAFFRRSCIMSLLPCDYD